ncbi:GGDEF domain-containing protein [Thalassospira marina]|uniref:diguanylate cyclase n=1 Tax=Thalassospira marina TaxID=2048283 RepID=A0A2N3KEE2_9PROT|nr:GGDEF domain-containing protein [Thalassospira marina]PKR48921.1 GGDEF domain-containing protein [Thalassospira marina]
MKDVDLPLLQSLIKAAETRPVPQHGENGGLTTELTTLVKHVRSLQERLDQSENRVKQLEGLVDTDDLTGLLNRRGFTRQLSLHLGENTPEMAKMRVIIADLDGFKNTNDAYGHAAGDAVLRHFARLITKHLPRQGFAGRLGGDEFAIAIYAPGVKDAERFIARVKSSLHRAPIMWQQAQIRVQASFGMAKGAENSDLEGLLHSADQEMYRDKHRNPATNASMDDAILREGGKNSAA